MDKSRGLSGERATLLSMTAMPSFSAPVVPMTSAEYAALPEDGDIRYELQEGVLVPTASTVPEHQLAVFELMRQISDGIRDGLRVVSDIDIDLQIVLAHRPGFVRRSDISVVTAAGIARRRSEGGILRASELFWPSRWSPSARSAPIT